MKFYVRILRVGRYQLDDPFDFEDVEYKEFPVEESSMRELNFMYNYFIISKV